jgi:hypothetical protein
MITDFDDLCLWTYVIVDDMLIKLAPLLRRPGSSPDCSDSELITMILIAECKGWDIETQLLSEFSQHPHLFPILPCQTRFNRRRRNLGAIINRMRQMLLSDIEGAEEKLCIIDSLPIPVIQFHLAPSSSNDWSCYGADYGRVESMKQTIFGYKLHLLVTAKGVIVDFELAPASKTDLSVGYELLSGHQDKQVIGDKAYISTQIKEQLAQVNRIELITVPRRNQKQQISRQTKRWINQIRQIVETVNGQLSQQFHIQNNHAHSFWGVCTRLYAKLTAHTLCIYLNQLSKKEAFLQIKELAFPVP